MAAPIRYFSTLMHSTRCTLNASNIRHNMPSLYARCNVSIFSGYTGSGFRKFSSFSGGPATKAWLLRARSKRFILLTAGVALPIIYLADLYRRTNVVLADVGVPFKFKPIRRIRSDSDPTGLKLTIFQYQNCPFCCKARAYLDSRGFSYDVVEVNSVWRKEIKWSKYRKVPILVAKDMGPDGYLQINDSSVIISALETLLENRDLTLDKVLEYYPSLASKEHGRSVTEIPNKYFIMMKERSTTPALEAEQAEERKWREWTDDVLIHTLAPNMYRTLSEAKDAFEYFSKVGEWEKVFNTYERMIVIYVGTVAMYVLGKILKRRYKLKHSVRLSLYDACIEWTKAIGPTRRFLGGDVPNLADISVFGVMSSFEGCLAFEDARKYTDIGEWYDDVKKCIDAHKGHVLPD